MNVANGVTLTAAATAFDRIAATYDGQFTHTNIGQAQRKQVWQSLLAAFPVGSRILELNCGTGEDARFLVKHGRSVVACDASASMIDVAKRSDRNEGQSSNIEYLWLPNEQLGSFPAMRSFDGAFSNFSGLNCLADLSQVARDLANLVKPKGRLLICVWSHVCVAEILWCLLHGQLKKSTRRFQRNALARLGGLTISVTYHTVSGVRRSFSPWFELRSRRAIGLFVPPSYAEQWMSRNVKLLAGLELLDHAFAQLPLLRDLGDHVLLEFARCNR
jgi:ubiquinone/menaquinone biosynthesis C-methylase UbiE